MPELYLSGTGAEVYAMQVTRENLQEVADWTGGEVMEYKSRRFETAFGFTGIRFQTWVLGTKYAGLGEWVVRYKHADSHIYTYTNTVFQAMFTKV